MSENTKISRQIKNALYYGSKYVIDEVSPFIRFILQKHREYGEGRIKKKIKSVAFFYNSYYHYGYLAAELRRRGWDAVSVNVDDLQGPDRKFWHGMDVDLFDENPEKRRKKIKDFESTIQKRFGVVFFYGMGRLSLYPENWFNDPYDNNFPYDIDRLRSHGVIIGHTPTGCFDISSQTAYREWSSNACSSCKYETMPEVCSDLVNLSRGQRIYPLCDVIECEQIPALDYLTGDKVYHGPLTFALDPNFWSPDLLIPEKHLLKRTDDELIVYHGVANFAQRDRDGRNIKGTWAIEAAIEQLRKEGMNVRLEFRSNVPNVEVRYIQAQADVIVDQLLLGRYGAQAREGMMLGKPVIAHINRTPDQLGNVPEWVDECPIIDATPDTLLAALRDLLSDPHKRALVGSASRDYALKYYSTAACADRFERVIDSLIENRTVPKFTS